MKTWPPFLCLGLLIVSSLAGFERGNPPDEVLKRECAGRLLKQYGPVLAPTMFSLVRAFLQNLEHRRDACERIQQNYNILLRHDYYTAYGRDVNWRDSSLRLSRERGRGLEKEKTAAGLDLNSRRRMIAGTQPPP